MKKLILLCSALGWLFLVLALTSCQKDDELTPTLIQYEITYFVQSDSAYIEYNVGDINLARRVSDWDTTFTSAGGWTINVCVTPFAERLTTGIIVDGDTLDGCVGAGICFMGFYLEE